MAPSQSAASLICVKSFSAFGKDYGVGQEVPVEDTRRWPEGTLDRRLENGSVTIRAALPVETEEVIRLELPPEAAATKAALEAWVKTNRPDLPTMDYRKNLDLLVAEVKTALESLPPQALKPATE